MTDSPARPRGPYAKTSQRREEILRAAREVFAERGYEAASVRQVAARVGISEAGLTHHFATKSELLAAVLQARGQEDADRWGSGGAIPPEHLVDLVAHNSTRPEIVRLFTKLTAEATSLNSPVHEHFAERYAGLRRRTAEQIRRAQGQGEMRADVDADVAAQVLLAVMDGLQVQWLYDRDVDMAHAMDVLLSSWLTRAFLGAEKVAGKEEQ
jgi:AcrR family transcriptional regulator